MAVLEIGVDTAPSRRCAGSARLGALFVCAVGWIALIGLAAIFADLLPIASPTDMDLLGKRAPPSAEHLLGTDQLGRDVLSRLIYGARISLTVGLLAPVIGVTIGGCLGMLAGYFRGRFETLAVGGVDVLLAFPPLVFALAVTAYLGQSVLNITLVIGVLGIPGLHARGARRHPVARASASSSPPPARSAPRMPASCCASCCPTWRCR